MIKRFLPLAIFILLFGVPELTAQSFRCGVNLERGAMIQQQMIENRNEMRDYVQLRNATVYLPVRFYLVAKSDGSERIGESVALKALCNLNNNYADQDIQFYLKEFKYVNNTQLYNNASTGFAFSTLSSQTIYNAINIFLVKDAGDGAAAYYQPPAGPNGNDWIVSSGGEADNFETLTHEVGHFFSLNHPFYGWESSNGWNLADHGNPVGTYSPGGVLNEFADGSNCENAGDMICDTPADYMFPFPGPDGCTYTGNVMDPHGDLIDPDLTNFMNYGSCNNNLYHFTDQQKEEIQNSLNSSSRNYIPKNHVPNLALVESVPTLLSPQQLETVPTYNSVHFEWTPVENAEKYLLVLNNTETGKSTYILDGTEITLTDLLPDNNYFWKVLAFSEYSTCKGFSSQRIVKTGSETVTDTNEIPQLSGWSLSPNPVRSGEIVLLNVESVADLTADMAISTITGQRLRWLPGQPFAKGITTLPIETYDMPAGVYLVTLFSANGVETKRISIL